MREQHAGAFAGGVERVVGAVEAKAAPEIDIVDAGGLEPVAPFRARAARRKRLVVDQRQAREICVDA